MKKKTFVAIFDGQENLKAIQDMMEQVSSLLEPDYEVRFYGSKNENKMEKTLKFLEKNFKVNM